MAVNVQLGLRRVSAAWWGLWGLLSMLIFLGGGVGFFTGKSEWYVPLLGGLIGAAICYIAHKVTCWIVAGFFSPRS